MKKILSLLVIIISVSCSSDESTTENTNDITAPTVPINLIATNTNTTTTELSWSASTDNIAVTGYNVYQGGLLIATVSNTSYTVTGLSATTHYYYTVKAVDAAGNLSVASNTVDINTLCPTTTNYAPVHFDLEWRGTWRNVTTNKMMYVSEHNITIEFPDGTTRSYCHAVQYATQHAPDAVFSNGLMIEPQMFVTLDNIAYTTKRLTIHQNGTDIINAIYALVP